MQESWGLHNSCSTFDNQAQKSDYKRRKGETIMPSAAALRIQIEHSLERRFPAALTPTPRTIRETAPTGIPPADRMLEGGLPVGAISEITGPVSSGRTSLALSFVAGRTREDCVCAWVDASDSLDAESAAACGVRLNHLLWVRCRATAPVCKLKNQPTAKPWAQLDQAVRATDLLLQAGGFSAIVLDLGNTAHQDATRIPLASWFRFRQAADRTRCSLVVLAQQPLAQSSSAVVLECSPHNAQSSNQTVLSGYQYQLQTDRLASHPSSLSLAGRRKPPASCWSATAPWQRECPVPHQLPSDNKYQTEPPGPVSFSSWEKSA
jgi:hypothetical protein